VAPSVWLLPQVAHATPQPAGAALLRIQWAEPAALHPGSLQHQLVGAGGIRGSSELHLLVFEPAAGTPLAWRAALQRSERALSQHPRRDISAWDSR
jgi:hypothetical protein